jgi:DNA polymerase-3 subunit gamma/tau
VHVQRLVPIEELLSQLGAKPTSTPSTKPSSISAPREAVVSSPFVASTPRSVSSSPFATDTSRKTPVASVASTPVEPQQPATTGSMALAPEPVAPATQSGPQLVVASLPVVADSATVESSEETSSYVIPQPAVELSSVEATEDKAPVQSAAQHNEPVVATGSINLIALQHKLSAALAAVKGQTSASEQIEDAAFALNGDTLIIQTELSKTMLPVVINADAERILKATLRDADASLRLQLLPGAPAPTGKPKAARAAASGSAADLAQKHPLVQQAIELFSAEISNVIDLREK